MRDFPVVGALRRVLLLLLVLAPASARADVEVESESVYQNDAAAGLSGDDVVLAPFSQAFRLMAAETTGRTRLSVETYFRGVGEPNPFVPDYFQQTSRVYYAYVDAQYGKRNPVDLRIGRQPSTAGGDVIFFDGARLRYRGPDHFGLEIYGGTTVSGYGALVPLGLEDGGPNEAGGQLGGIAVFLNGVERTQARIGFRRVDRLGGVDREDLIADFAHREGRVRYYADMQASSVLLLLEEGEMGSSWYAGKSTFLEGELFHYTPTFGARSIFNVFSLSPYDEARVRLRTTVGGTGLWARVGHAIYEGGSASSDNISAGLNTVSGEHAAVELRTYYSGGWQGSRTGLSGDLRWRFHDNRVMLLGGVTLAEARTDILPGTDGTYLSALAGVTWQVPDRAELDILAEQYSDNLSGNGPRLTATFRFQFGAGFARRSALEPARRQVIP